MTKEQEVSKLLLDYQTELNAMIASNESSRMRGDYPAYEGWYFMELKDKYEKQLKALETKVIEA